MWNLTQALPDKNLRDSKPAQTRKVCNLACKNMCRPLYRFPVSNCEKSLHSLLKLTSSCFYRYIKSSTLADTKTLILEQEKGETESNAMKEEFQRFKHPESNRLQEMVSIAVTFLRKRNNHQRQACPTFLVLRATFTWGNLLRATNVFVT